MFDQNRRSLIPLKSKNFCCPICGSEEYKQIIKNDYGTMGPGGFARLAYNECEGCSVHFGDAEKLKRQKK